MSEESPSAIWQELELRCIDDLGLLAQIGGPDSREHVFTVRTRLAESIILWWSSVFRCWTQGLIGQDAVSPGSALNPATVRQLPFDLTRFAQSL